MKKVAFYTLGCKVNQYETEAMLELFEKDGYEQVNSEEYADVYVINTCTVTHMSDRKSRQYIRRVKKKNPDAVIAVVGCYSQVSPEEILDIEEVNLVMGTNDRRKIVEEIKKIDASKKVSTVDDIMKVKAFEEIEISQTNGKTRAFMKIQDGCDRFCTYCIIPYARGRVRSRDIDSIVDEVKKLANNGYKEVVLTGIHVASYGKDLKDKDIKLLDVIKQINEIDKIERIRLSSVEPILFTDEFVNEVLKMDKVCPHYHLSLQSGCDETLKRMNRRYTTSEYKTIVDRLRSKMPNVAITTDVIVGFPGETNDEFKETYEFLKEIELSQMHIFKYSPRKGTPAATMENQVDPQMKHFRSEQLLNLSKVNFNKFANKFIGSELDVLFEQNTEGNKFEGLTSNYIRVVVESDKNIQGQILKVKINDVKDEYVEGILI
ncbi:MULTISPECIES: tRNA (N(6)-L-threonylcarbamoyladenosine(37)-C(2))-methylthiotransferase MtaB [unclassified Clostridioides]|uniref:tRNA (N(6)-L-threonylcarbamoyladenosine(37)-C(2))- methylthiotransferase MtaB n=1 Tax=unclassified Clostridioides TaxID=2635829 RepID=UPI0007BADEBC|nr:tRNA (N(6)-L-threonylcarbamoyladenosine(37)-C(2))-methylthiotransferase MtaB [Clostridioides sp. ZZV14-6387]MDI0265255.1 tRNA (N(6)-L-threonylcarbamoyladenosine(37)-C(2))-methylthiotransferase MtaB [Clostridioides difficile]CZR97976.1 Threonylcarbamoyladenosine tRNA methylthiotransferase MtaB [Clostridioides difficile]CZS02456.1 Threonylcarbamoyladenosine tRNA methylthiotransferase MtaB [Clostridioides difficile]